MAGLGILEFSIDCFSDLAASIEATIGRLVEVKGPKAKTSWPTLQPAGRARNNEPQVTGFVHFHGT